MKKYLLFATALLAGHTMRAQVTNYQFNYESGQFLELSDYPGAVITDHDVQDDVLSPGKLKLTFPFRFNGQTIDSVGVHENGYLFFGSIDPFAIGGFWPISSVHPSSVTGIVSALGLDLHPVDIPGQHTTIKTAIVGTAPLRIFIAEWKGTSRIDAVFHPAGADNITFQIRLYETTNRVELTYGNFGLNPNIMEDAEIGIKGATYSDYSNRVPQAANWSTSVSGTSQLSRKALSSASKPEYGTLYVWMPGTTPPPPPTAIVEHGAVAPFILYPVPAKDVLHVRADAGNLDMDNLNYQVTDLSGRKVLSGRLANKSVRLDNLGPGTYVLVLDGKKGSSSRIFSKS